MQEMPKGVMRGSLLTLNKTSIALVHMENFSPATLRVEQPWCEI